MEKIELSDVANLIDQNADINGMVFHGKEFIRVVRCKDCKWYEIEQLKRDGTDDKRYKPSVCVIGKYAKPRKADWYCADGERREDAEIN